MAPPLREFPDEQPVATPPEAAPEMIGLIDMRGGSVLVMDVLRQLADVPVTEGKEA